MDENSRLVRMENVQVIQSDEPKTKTRFRKMYLAALTSLLFSVSIGMGGSFSATATDNMQRRESLVSPSMNDISWIGSLLALGAFFGSTCAGLLSDTLGRKGSMLSLALPTLIGWLFIAYAKDVWFIFIGRFITGICVGAICPIIPAYLVEISTPEVRGMLGSFFQVSACIGVLFCNTLAVYMTWNWLAISSAVVVVMALVMFSFMPESPRWLIAKGRYQDAERAVTFLQGQDFDVAGECLAIRDDLSRQPQWKMTWEEITRPEVSRPALLGIGLLVFQQLCGINAILFFTVEVFKSASTPLSAYQSTILLDAVLVIMTVVGSLLLDKVGRKILLIISGSGMAVTLFILAGFDYAATLNKTIKSDYTWVPLTTLLIYITVFSLGYGPIPWLMMSEMSPNRARGFIGAVVSAFCWGFLFLVTESFAFLRLNLKDYGTYCLYGFCSALSCVFAVYCLPETKGKRVEDMQTLFSKVDRKQKIMHIQCL